MSMSEWAENEVKLACKKENPDWDDESFDYGCGCYQSALKAYKSLCEDGHSGFSFSITRNILIRLMKSLPLTPIEDTEDTWNETMFFNDDLSLNKNSSKKTQCKRMGSLFKTINEDGSISYTDVSRAYCIDVDTKDTFNCFVENIIDDMFPITMPYYPPVNKYKVYVKDFIAKGYFGDTTDFNTRAVLYCITPEGEKVEINRYFADSPHNNRMEEITTGEYLERIKHIEVKK